MLVFCWRIRAAAADWKKNANPHTNTRVHTANIESVCGARALDCHSPLSRVFGRDEFSNSLRQLERTNGVLVDVPRAAAVLCVCCVCFV